MLLVRSARPLLLFAAMLLAGCEPAVSHDRLDYVGEYIFTPNVHDLPTRAANFVKLRADGSAVEVRFDTSGKLAATETTWTLIDSQTGLGVVIAGFRHSVSRKGSSIHLDSNADLNEYYEKVR